jgi:hypothetical protein
MAGKTQEPRFLCSELVQLIWENPFGRSRQATVNLEEIWRSGACLSLDSPVRPGSPVRIRTREADYRARVRSCKFSGIEYMAQVDFEPGYEWSVMDYVPENLFDPRTFSRPLSAKLPPRKSESQAQENTIIEALRKIAGDPRRPPR